MVASDVFDRPIDLEAIRRQKLNDAGGTYAVLDQSRRLIEDDAGPITSIHRGQKAFEKAHKATKKLKHARVVKLKGSRNWQLGDHINSRSEIEHEHTARFG